MNTLIILKFELVLASNSQATREDAFPSNYFIGKEMLYLFHETLQVRSPNIDYERV